MLASASASAQRGIDEAFAGGDAAHRDEQHVGARALGDVARGARLQRAAHRAGFVVHAQHQNRQRRAGPARICSIRLVPVAPGMVRSRMIIGAAAPGSGKGLGCVGGFLYHVQAGE
jgi:hypothetical protein